MCQTFWYLFILLESLKVPPIERETEAERQRNRKRQRDRDRDRKRQKETETEREIARGWLTWWWSLVW